ncbi:MAG: hypothetical protein INQ03_02065 [Candidatus Heimdallarchaeota archaeon]|nr:hypothetical protein [Candidatus Heimdallarchaeota archaeon]
MYTNIALMYILDVLLGIGFNEKRIWIAILGFLFVLGSWKIQYIPRLIKKGTLGIVFYLFLSYLYFIEHLYLQLLLLGFYFVLYMIFYQIQTINPLPECVDCHNYFESCSEKYADIFDIQNLDVIEQDLSEDLQRLYKIHKYY